jgi:dipeptidyl aminopeptidase/acylaminoacyl peptidase
MADRRLTFPSILFVCLFTLPLNERAALAADKHPLNIDELIDLKAPSAPSISPDGRFVAYSVQQANWAENRYETQIWLVNTQTGEPIQLTNSKRSNSDAAWSPDGRWLGFISDRDGTRQIYVISPLGGEARQVTAVETGVGQFAWSPNGTRIAFTMADPDGEEIKRRRERYSDFEIVRHEYRMDHLWVLEISSSKLRRLTQGNGYTVNSFSWSPDGRRLAFDALAAPTLSAESTANVYVCDVESGLVSRLIDGPGPNRKPNWSPDGKSIVFETTMGHPNFFTQDVYFGIVSAEGGTVEYITVEFDERVSFVAWGPEGIYFTAAQKTAEHLFCVEPKTHKIERISPQHLAAYRSFSFAKDFKRVAFVEADATHYPEVYVSGSKMLDPKKLTNYAAQLNDFKLATREVISWKSSDATIIEGALMKPADFDPTKKYPLLVVIHGGPGDTTSQAVLEFDTDYPKEMWVAKGALILEPNYRGSAGYGQKFHQLLVRNMGAGDYDDVISGVDFLIAKGWVDKDRVGAMGWSFGGFVSAWIATNSDRFKAVSVGAGATDWVMFDAFTELQEATRQYLAASPSGDPEIYRKNSPITNVKQAKTPTMIEHGEFDPIVPLAGAYELYQGLLDQGVPVRFYLYRGFGHIITTPKGNRTVMEHNLNWFNHYIWGEPDQELQ